MSSINPSRPEKGKNNDAEISGKKRGTNVTSMLMIKMTIQKHENNVENCILEEMNLLTAEATLKGNDIIRSL